MNQRDMRNWVARNCRFAQQGQPTPMGQPAPAPTPPPKTPAPMPAAQPQQYQPTEEESAMARLKAIGQPVNANALGDLHEVIVDDFDGIHVRGLESDPYFGPGGGGTLGLTVYFDIESEPYHGADMNGPEEGGTWGNAAYAITEAGNDVLALIDPKGLSYINGLIEREVERYTSSRRHDDYDNDRGDDLY